MKLKFYTILLASLSVFCLTSCKAKKSTVVDGGGQDSHGCMGNAGYSWSNLSERCLKPIDSGIDLHHVKSKSSDKICYLVMFDSLSSMELFMPSGSESIVMAADGSEWVNTTAGYRLKLNTDLRYELYNSKEKLIYKNK